MQAVIHLTWLLIPCNPKLIARSNASIQAERSESFSACRISGRFFEGVTTSNSPVEGRNRTVHKQTSTFLLPSWKENESHFFVNIINK